MALQERPIEEAVIDHLLACLTIFLRFFFTFFELGVAREVVRDLVEELASLLENMQLHSLGKRIIALLHDVYLCRGLGLQRLEEVSLVLLRVFLEDLVGEPETLLVCSLDFFAKFLRSGIVLKLEEGVVQYLIRASCRVVLSCAVEDVIRIIRLHFFVMLLRLDLAQLCLHPLGCSLA